MRHGLAWLAALLFVAAGCGGDDATDHDTPLEEPPREGTPPEEAAPEDETGSEVEAEPGAEPEAEPGGGSNGETATVEGGDRQNEVLLLGEYGGDPSAGDSRSTVTIGTPTPQPGGGTFEASQIMGLLRGRSSAIRRCHDQAIADHPGVAGVVRVELTIVPNGSVRSARVLEDGPGEPTLAACVVGIIERLRFRDGPRGGPVTFHVPITLAAR